MKRCDGFLGHRFEPRFDIKPPSINTEAKGSAGGLAMIIEAATTRIYVHDICVRCGKVVARNATDDSRTIVKD